MESIRIKKWIFHTLTNDPEITALAGDRIHSSIPPGAVYPLIEFGLQAGRDVRGNGKRRLMSTPLFRIVAIGRDGLSDEFTALVERLDEIFQNARSVIFQGYVFSSFREIEIAYDESGGEQDSSFNHNGGLYRVICYKI